jgi:hypothetical protein
MIRQGNKLHLSHSTALNHTAHAAAMLQRCGILAGTSYNQYITPSTHHLHNGLKLTTHHINASSITPHKLNNFNSQDFNHDPFLTYIYITYIILTEIIIIFNFYVVTTQLTTLVPLYCCNNNSTLKMAVIVAETCW